MKTSKSYHILLFANMDEINYHYNGRFEGNVLTVGRTGCGKTTFRKYCKKSCLETFSRFGGYQNLSFLNKGNIILKPVLKI